MTSIIASAAVLLLATTACSTAGSGSGNGGPSGSGNGGGGSDSEGVSSKAIEIGALLPLSGAAADYGPLYQGGIEAYIDNINDNGGVNGRKIDLKIYDSGYAPAKALASARQAVDRDHVFALVSTTGTVVNTAIAKYLDQMGVPNFGVVSGKPEFSDPSEHPESYTYQMSYVTEAGIIHSYIQKNYPDAKVGILYQNDDYGSTYLNAFMKVSGVNVVSKQGYDPSSSDVSSQMSSLKHAGADVVLDFGVSKFVILALKAIANQGWHVPFIVTSPAIDPAVLKVAGAQQLEGLVGGTSFPPLSDTSQPVQEYKAQMAKYSPKTELGFSSMQTYGATRLFVEALMAAGENLTRSSFKKSAESLQNVSDLPLVGSVSLTTSDHAAIKCLRMVKYGSSLNLSYITEPICK